MVNGFFSQIGVMCDYLTILVAVLARLFLRHCHLLMSEALYNLNSKKMATTETERVEYFVIIHIQREM